MKKGAFFLVADTARRTIATRHMQYAPNIRVESVGEFRPPKKGEWYLSGAIVEGYRAGADLDAPYHIARLVAVHTVTFTVTRRLTVLE